AQLQAILDAMGEGVIYDENLQIKYVNQALVELTGYAEADWKEYPLYKQTAMGENFLRLWQGIYTHVRSKGIWRGETTIYRKDSSSFIASLVSAGMRDENGEIIGVVTLIRDISKE